MFRFWLQFHPLLILPVLIFVFSLSGGLIHWFQGHSPLRENVRKYVLAPQVFATTSMLFALFAGFLLAGLIAQKNSGLQAVETEAAALVTLATIDSKSAPDAKMELAGIGKAVRLYAASVVDDEWPQMLREQASPRTGEALRNLVRTVRDAEGLSSPVQGQMLSLVWTIAEARSDRIAIVTNHTVQMAWTALFLLGFLTQFAVGMSHLGSRRQNAAAISIFGAAAVIALWLIAIQDNPVRGPYSVSPAPMENVVRMLGG
ncbi:MAG: hypothetical protein RH982_13410 [Parvibaculum sp.]